MSELFPEEIKRIRWRQKLMAIPGGADWLAKVTKLYGHSERLAGPAHVGLPRRLRVPLLLAALSGCTADQAPPDLHECTCYQTDTVDPDWPVTTPWFSGYCEEDPAPLATLDCEADLPGGICQCTCEAVGWC